MSYRIQGVYIADGFADDCDELMHRCLQAGTLTFEVFSDIWKEMQLSCIYQGRSSGAEIAELSEEVLHIAKHYMVADTSNFEESVAGLFLVYSLMNLQPFAKFASLRIVQEDLPALERIELVARRDRRQDVLYVLGSILIQGPVQYQAVLRERGMEYPIRKYLEGYTTIDKLGVRPKGVFYRQNSELDLIRELKNLTVRYTTAKENIVGVKPDDRNLNYLDPNFANELDTSLKNIISGIIDEDVNTGDSSASCDAIKNIKRKAMKATVKPIRHRIAVDAKSKSNPYGPDIKTVPDKNDTNSPTKVATNKKTKDKNRAKKRKLKQNFSASEDSDEFTAKDSEFETENDCASDPGYLDLTKFNQAVTKDNTLLENEQQIEIEIDNLPTIIRSEYQGMSYEIEIIDELDEGTTSRLNSPSTSVSASDTANVKRADKRDLKKSILKSRFKRMGMLPVANFQNK